MPALNDADLDLLSAYLDDELPPAERAALQRRLDADSALRADLDDLRRVAALVRASRLRAPRDFRLDPARYGRALRRVYAYRFMSAASALAAVLVLVIGLAALTAPAAAPAQFAAEDQAQANAAPTSIALAPTHTPVPSPTPALADAASRAASATPPIPATAFGALTEIAQALDVAMQATAEQAVEEAAQAAAVPPVTSTGQDETFSAPAFAPPGNLPPPSASPLPSPAPMGAAAAGAPSPAKTATFPPAAQGQPEGGTGETAAEPDALNAAPAQPAEGLSAGSGAQGAASPVPTMLAFQAAPSATAAPSPTATPEPSSPPPTPIPAAHTGQNAAPPAALILAGAGALFVLAVVLWMGSRRG